MKRRTLITWIGGGLLFLALGVPMTTSIDVPQTVAAEDANPADAAPFSGMVVFGDSLSDTGNFFAMSGQPGYPYYEGRFSNGMVWVEHLAEDMGMDPVEIENFAVSGATTGRENYFDVPGVIEFPGVQDELDHWENLLEGKSADPRALHVVLAGANDFYVHGYDLDSAIAGIQNTIVAIQRLHDAGARRILVVGLPDLGVTPDGRIVDPVGLSWLSWMYNTQLEIALDELEANGVETIHVDLAEMLQEILADPQSFGITNYQDSYIATGGDPAGFLFWDTAHPTTRGHELIADTVMSELREQFANPWVTPRH